tara:strand:+ start:170 stop:574 length:405 start_codon:yes stop_codon:yes gene_type:complete
MKKLLLLTLVALSINCHAQIENYSKEQYKLLKKINFKLEKLENSLENLNFNKQDTLFQGVKTVKYSGHGININLVLVEYKSFANWKQEEEFIDYCNLELVNTHVGPCFEYDDGSIFDLYVFIDLDLNEYITNHY